MRILHNMDVERLQQQQYDKLIDKYDATYGDDYSQQYRCKYIYKPMFDSISLKGMNVLEAMSGSGQVTDYLLSHGAIVTGLDISKKSIQLFKERWPGSTAVCCSLLNSGLPSESFDCVVVMGGLHHVQPHSMQAIDEAYRLLKPGGYFCFAEPFAGSFLDTIRKIWYRHDPLFAKNEQAIDIEFLKNEYADRFEIKKEKFIGNVAYIFVMNAMILRIPAFLRRWYAPFLLRMEYFLERILGKRFSCFCLNQWRKKYVIK
ncbi:MAG TPA: hypothetical protein DCL49_08215 [Candidatus Omnitrophica bacterium]|nr:hypothetical protein [Candidatus Omnitrophota bacterium]HBG64537.1 hypothetical protein [Candidatus Omnitrophota bacterium]